jgi:hypothetical protein
MDVTLPRQPASGATGYYAASCDISTEFAQTTVILIVAAPPGELARAAPGA